MTTTDKNAEIVRALWEPHPGQTAVMNLDTRFRIVAAGRRWGKTKMAAHEALEYALNNSNAVVWWVAPSYTQANDFGYDQIEPLITPDVLADRKRTTPRRFEFKNGSRIDFRSGEREDSLRGPGIDFLVIDEAGSVPGRAWRSELRPALSDTNGDMLAIGTPRGRNWFYDWYQRGQSPDHADTASVRAPTTQNPHVPDSEVESAQSEIPERVFRQEYLAEFVDDTGGVFQDVRDHVEDYNLPVDPTDAAEPYAIGVDFARFEDYTAIVVLDADGRVVGFDRLRETTWTQIQQRVEHYGDTYTPCHVAVDASRDNKIVSDLEASGLDVEAVKFTRDTKQTMIDNLITRLETGEITLSSDAPALINELEVFEFERTDAGNVRYTAPSGFHDDTVDALALAAHVREETDTKESFMVMGGGQPARQQFQSARRGGYR